MVLIKLTSDNFNGELLTPNVYEAIVLSMSTGDHATHKAEPIVLPYSDKRCEQAVAFSDQILIEMRGEN